MKKIKVKKILIISILLIMLSAFFLPNMIQADGRERSSSYDTTFKEFMTNESWRANRSRINPLGYGSYDAIMDLSPSEICQYMIQDTWSWYSDWRDYYMEGTGSNSQSWWEREHQVMCMEGAVIGTSSAYSYPYAVIDINKDGTKPGEATVYVNGSSRDIPDNKWNAIMACYSAKCEEAGHASLRDSGYYGSKKGFAYFWNNGYSSFLSGYVSPLPGSANNASASYAAVSEAMSYGENYKTAATTYQARIILCKGGASQSRAIVYGKEAEAKAGCTIEKYITKVEGLSDTSITKSFGETRKISESGLITCEDDKETKPVGNVPGDDYRVTSGEVKVTFKIVLNNEGDTEIKGTLTDNPDTTFYQQGSMTWSPSASGTITIPAKSRKEFTLTIEGNPRVITGKYENKAVFKKNGSDDKIESSDWIEISPDNIPKINKYITSISGSGTDLRGNGGNRSGLDEGQKQSDPAIAGKNDETHIVNYVIEIENVGNSDIEGEFRDVISPNISISLSGASNGGQVYIRKNSKITIRATAIVPEGANAGLYTNTASIEVRRNSISF